MIIRHNGNTHTIARMTGNQHNILEITLADTCSPIKIRPLILKGEESTINITPEEVDFHVARGVNLIYGKYQRTFFHLRNFLLPVRQPTCQYLRHACISFV